MSPSETKILQWIESLRSPDAVTRMQARYHLVAAGPKAVAAVSQLLSDPVQHLRWAAASVLRDIASPEAVPALVEALGDRDCDVSWVAGEALAAIGEPCVAPLLRRLTSRPRPRERKPALLYRGAHEVLQRVSKRAGKHRFGDLLKALKADEAEVYVPVAAEQVLEKLAKGKETIVTVNVKKKSWTL